MHTIINEWWAVATVAAIRGAATEVEAARMWRDLRDALTTAWIAETFVVGRRLRSLDELRERALKSRPPSPLGHVLWALRTLARDGKHGVVSLPGASPVLACEIVKTMAAAHPLTLTVGCARYAYGVEA